MTAEELLRPRYKVIDTYPFNNHFVIGETITAEANGIFKILQKGHSIVLHTTEFEAGYFDKFPHIFRKIEWWAERKIEDMPKYVKSNYDNGSLKMGDSAMVDKWIYDDSVHLSKTKSPFFCYIEGGVPNKISAMNLLPYHSNNLVE